MKIEPKRSYIAFGCITAFLCVLVGRAFYLQCGLGTKFLQHQGEIRFARTLTVPAVRGRILDRNGIVLASTMPARSVWVVPAETEKATPQQLARLGSFSACRFPKSSSGLPENRIRALPICTARLK
mgnify:CR=1 FL=1